MKNTKISMTGSLAVILLSLWFAGSGFAQGREPITADVDRTSLSTGEILYCFNGSVSLESNRRSCSSLETEKKNLNNTIPFFTSIDSSMGVSFKNRLFSSSVQKPIVGSTMARLYQLRSKSTISPPDGRC